MMTTTTPSTVRLRVLALRSRLILTEVQLVDDALLYQRIDGRDNIPTEVRAVRPSAVDWANLRLVLDAAGVWSWPRRWPHLHDGFIGEFAIGLDWAGRAVVSAGPIGVAPVVNDVLATMERLVGGLLAPQAMSAHLSPAPPLPYRSIAVGAAEAA